ncbi:hypothetical protein M8494_25305 [Serratia ureilytica]
MALMLLAACVLLMLVLRGSAARLHRRASLGRPIRVLKGALMRLPVIRHCCASATGEAAAAGALTQRLDDHHRAHAALLRQACHITCCSAPGCG